MSYFTLQNTNTPQQFMAMPKELFKDTFSNLSLDAKVLYSVLLDRVGLSIKNKWADKLGHVYVVCKQSEIMKILNIGRSKVTTLFKELEQFSLIERRKRGNNLPDVIYVMNISEKVINNSVDKSVDKLCINESSSNNDFSMPKPMPENKHTGCLKNKRPGCVKIKQHNKTNQNNTDYSETTPINHTESHNDKENGLMDFDTAKKNVQEQICYDAIVSNQPDETVKDLCNTIVSIMAESYSRKFGKININGCPVGFDYLREFFSRLNQFHIEYVLESVLSRDALAEPIKNMKAYLATALCNAPGTIDLYYKQQVKHSKRMSTVPISYSQDLNALAY